MNKNKYFLNILIFLVILCFGTHLYAQQSNTMYFMKGIPQTQMYNPANQPRCNIFIGLPGISNVGADVAINSLNLSEVMHYNDLIDSTVFALNPYDGDPDAFLDNFGRKNYISGLTNLNILSFGFRKDNKYFTFGYRVKASARFLYPTDFMRLAVEGIEHGNEFNFNDFRVDATAYQEFSFGLSKQYDPYLSVGINTKILFGLANFSQRNTNINLTLDHFTAPVNVSFEQNMNIPFTTIVYTDERVDSIVIEEDLRVSDFIKHGFSNIGLGFDAGFNYNFDERLAISTSIIDLGFIRWKSNTANIKQDASYLFTGAYYQVSDTFDSKQFMEDLLDSLDNNLIVHQNSESKYTTALPAKIYLGGTYMVNKNMQIGMLSRTEFFKKKMYQQLTFSTSFFPNKAVSPTFSYSLMNKSYLNLGFGATIKIGWVHLYFISDNIPVVFAEEVNDGYPVPYKTKSVNFHCGMNLLFGCKKGYKDRPIVE